MTICDLVVVLNPAQSWIATFEVMLHEFAHALLGHLGPRPAVRQASNLIPHRARPAYGAREFEANAAASGRWCRCETGGVPRAEEGSAMSETDSDEWAEGPCRTPEACGGEATAVSVDVSEPSGVRHMPAGGHRGAIVSVGSENPILGCPSSAACATSMHGLTG